MLTQSKLEDRTWYVQCDVCERVATSEEPVFAKWHIPELVEDGKALCPDCAKLAPRFDPAVLETIRHAFYAGYEAGSYDGYVSDDEAKGFPAGLHAYLRKVINKGRNPS